jgi:hypothetical protein
MADIHAHQIFYDKATRDALDPAFLPLDNSANERPDWYEYGPIRRFFAQHSALDDDAFYGFFSPLFHSKTQLTGRQVLGFARQNADADVITFSPHPDHGAVFTSVFEHGARLFPGFLDVAVRFLNAIDPAFRINSLVNDARDVVFSNYFLARPKFWRAWRSIYDRTVEWAETKGHPVGEALNRAVTYSKDGGDAKAAQMKIMVLECVPSLILGRGGFRVRNYPPFSMPLTARFAGHLAELEALNQLKATYRDTGNMDMIRLFVERRERLLDATRGRGP